MTNLAKKIAAEKESIERTLSNLLETMNKRDKSVAELAGIAAFIHNIYSGIENILKQIFQAKEITLPQSESWHKELLELSAQNQILPRGLTDKLYQYLTFRHYFVHSYGFTLKEEKVAELVNNISAVYKEFLSSIKSFELG